MGWIQERFGSQAETLVKNIKNKVVVSEEEHKQRLDVCKSCEKLQRSTHVQRMPLLHAIKN